jgi:hypothetical protein
VPIKGPAGLRGPQGAASGSTQPRSRRTGMLSKPERAGYGSTTIAL